MTLEELEAKWKETEFEIIPEHRERVDSAKRLRRLGLDYPESSLYRDRFNDIVTALHRGFISPKRAHNEFQKTWKEILEILNKKERIRKRLNEMGQH